MAPTFVGLTGGIGAGKTEALAAFAHAGAATVATDDVVHELLRSAELRDALVERWGQEVVALVQLSTGASASADDIVAHAGQHIARYKLPKDVMFLDAIQRSPSGKADYRWAKAQVQGAGA